ncbi:MAG: hypothetical protein GY829_11845 [Gammaproteobacteria bacterium]|nr:hypothetical protein [Gammaproteobacteria bacterium]
MTFRSKILESWKGKPLHDVFEQCREVVEDPDYPTVKEWREQGGKVLGHFQVYFPEELAHAAGMLPLKVCGGQADGIEAESKFGSYLCSIIKTSLDLALTKKIEIELFVTHPICDAARNLGAIWGRNFPYKAQILYLPQNPNSKHSHEYLTFEYNRVKKDIEGIMGPISDESLKASMELFNKSRSLMRELYDIKRETPWLIKAEDAYCLTILAGMVTKEDYIELMSWVLPQIRERNLKKQDKMRVVFEGGFCESPPVDLIQTIERSCYLVDDDLFIGLRYILSDTSLDGDPVESLATAYIDQSSYSPVQHDNNKEKGEMLLARIKNSGAEAAIVSAAKMCEPGLEEQVTYIKMLEEEGIDSFVNEFEENQTSFDQIGTQLETFVENILFSEEVA